jgi:hypothetical protein
MKGYPGFSQKQLSNMLVKTNLPGFRKNEKQNVLLPESTSAIETVKAQRETYKKQKGLEDRIDFLEGQLRNVLRKIAIE